MAGLSTYNASNRVVSARVGYAILQADVQNYLTDSDVTSATTVQNLVDAVNAAVVTAGSEAGLQRLDIVRALQEGARLGDLSDARIAAATSVSDLALTYTWVSDDSRAAVNGHIGPNFYG